MMALNENSSSDKTALAPWWTEREKVKKRAPCWGSPNWVVLLYRESRHFEPNFLQYGASALLQTDNFFVGAIMKIVKKKKLRAVLQIPKKGKAPFCKFPKKVESRSANSQKKVERPFANHNKKFCAILSIKIYYL